MLPLALGVGVPTFLSRPLQLGLVATHDGKQHLGRRAGLHHSLKG